MSRRITVLGLGFFILTLALAGCVGPPRPPAEKVVYIVQTAPPGMLAQLAGGEIDGFVAWEPFNAQAVLEGKGKYLVTSRDIWKGHPCCVLAVSGTLGDRAVLRALVWAHLKATRFLLEPGNRDKVLQYAMDFTAASREVAAEGLKNTVFVEYPDEGAFKEYYRRLKEGGLLKKGYADIGYPSEEGFFSDFFMRAYYDEVAARLAADPDWVPEPVPAGFKVRLGYLARDLHQVQVYVAQREGFYEKVGLVPGRNLEVKGYANGVAVMEGFKVGDLDAAYLGGAPATLKRVNDGIDIRILGGANIEGSAIVVRQGAGIDGLQDLAGMTIAVPGLGTVQYYLLDKAVSTVNLKLKMK